jgi:hypothetical protein
MTLTRIALLVVLAALFAGGIFFSAAAPYCSAAGVAVAVALIWALTRGPGAGPAKKFRRELARAHKKEEARDFDGAKREYQELLTRTAGQTQNTEFLARCVKRLEAIRKADELVGKVKAGHNAPLAPPVEARKLESLPAAPGGASRPLRDRVTQDIVPLAEPPVGPAPVLGMDRRRYLRIPVEINVERVSIFSAGTARCAAKIRNIGGGGALLETTVPLEEDDTLLLEEVRLSPRLVLKEVFAKAVHVQQRDESYMVGVEFMYLDLEEKIRLQEFVAELSETIP